ncbi:hypothetical protein [Bosea sp. Tri-49]
MRDDATILMHQCAAIGCVHRMASPGKTPPEIIQA